jgi:hypothetical protein
MSMISFLNPPMFQKPDEIYSPLHKFSATTAPPAELEKEIQDAITELNLKANGFSASKSFTKDYLDLISQAKACAAKTQWNEAQKIIWEATFLLNQALESNAAGKFRKWMAVYYGCWLLLLAGIGWGLKHLEGVDNPAPYFGSMYWRYMIMGALGGLTIAFWGLIEHSAKLDFDRAFSVWYWLKPVLGAVMGLIAVLMVLAGMFAVQGKPELNSRTALYILAFLAGFSERFFVRIIDKLMTTLLGGDQSASASSKSGTAKGSASGPGKG